MQFVVIVIIFGENVKVIFIVYEDYQIIKPNSHVFSHVPYVVTLPSLIQLQFSFVFSHYLNVNQRLVDMVRTV